MAEKPAFLSQPGASSPSSTRPEGELLPFRDRGQTAPGGASMADELSKPNATEGQSSPPFKNLKG